MSNHPRAPQPRSSGAAHTRCMKNLTPTAPGTHQALGCVCGRQRAPWGRGCGPTLAFLEWGLQEGKGKGPRSLRAQSVHRQRVKAHSAASFISC